MNSREMNTWNIVGFMDRRGEVHLPVHLAPKQVLEIGLFKTKVCDWDVNPATLEKWDEFDNSDIVGIPLTEEWLYKFGFGKSVESEALYKDLKARMILWVSRGDCAEMDLIQDGKRISFRLSHIKHVHQLQNLYFDLTGEELKLKP